MFSLFAAAPLAIPSPLSIREAVGLASGAAVLGGAPDSGTVPFVVVCVACGLLAAVVMALPMAKQAEGFTPAYIAASVLHRSKPEDVSAHEALLIHHVAGAGAGVLYALLYLFVAGFAPGLVAVGGVHLIPHVVAALVVVVFIYALFAHLVLPRRGRGIYEERSTVVRGQWLRSVVVFGITIGFAVPAVATVL